MNINNGTPHTPAETSRRDILYIATGAAATVAAAGMVWPLISQMNPDASTLSAGLDGSGYLGHSRSGRS